IAFIFANPDDNYTRTDIASQLAERISEHPDFSAEPDTNDNTRIVISATEDSNAFSYQAVGTGMLSPVTHSGHASYSDTFFTEATLTFGMEPDNSPVKNDVWSVTPKQVSYYTTAGAASETILPQIDAKIYDDLAAEVITNVPSKLVVHEPTRTISLGEGILTETPETELSVLKLSYSDFRDLGQLPQIRALTENIHIAGSPSLDHPELAYAYLPATLTPNERIAIFYGDQTIEFTPVSTHSDDVLRDLKGLIDNVEIPVDSNEAIYSRVTEVGTEYVALTGGFGLETLPEAAVNNSLFTAQNIGAGKWTRLDDPSIVQATQTPHITIKGTGDGNTDFYRFTITKDMFAAAGADQPINGHFDIDNGFELGDPEYWRSTIVLRDQAGDILASATGNHADASEANTAGSDAYLAYAFPHAQVGMTFYLEITADGGTGLPDGVNYDLHASIDHHPTSGLIFSPEPQFDNETNQAEDGSTLSVTITDGNVTNVTGAQDIDDAAGFFTISDTTVGNSELGGTVDFTTPYTRIRGTGNGTYDLYRFTVTDEMLRPVEVDTSVNSESSSIDDSPYFTNLKYTLDGSVNEGDVWRLGTRYRTYEYITQPNDGLRQVALGLQSQLNSAVLADGITRRYDAELLEQGDSIILHVRTLVNEDQQATGFNLKGAQELHNGLTAYSADAGTAIRRAGALNKDELTNTSFTDATLTLVGTPQLGEEWTIIIDGTPLGSYLVEDDATNTDSIATWFADQVDGNHLNAFAAGSQLSLSSSNEAGFTVQTEIEGSRPNGQVTVSGSPVNAHLENVNLSSAILSITEFADSGESNIRLGERWSFDISFINSSNIYQTETISHTVTSSSAAEITSDFRTQALNYGFNASANANVLTLDKLHGDATISNNELFNISPMSVSASGLLSLVTNPNASSSVVEINDGYQAGDTWRLTVKDGNADVLAIATHPILANQTVDTIAESLSDSISAVSGLHATPHDGTILISRHDSGEAFTISHEIEAPGSLSTSNTQGRTVSLTSALVPGDTWTLTTSGPENISTDHPVEANQSLEAIATVFKTGFNGSTAYEAFNDSTLIHLVSNDDSLFASDLTITANTLVQSNNLDSSAISLDNITANTEYTFTAEAADSTTINAISFDHITDEALRTSVVEFLDSLPHTFIDSLGNVHRAINTDGDSFTLNATSKAVTSLASSIVRDVSSVDLGSFTDGTKYTINLTSGASNVAATATKTTSNSVEDIQLLLRDQINENTGIHNLSAELSDNLLLIRHLSDQPYNLTFYSTVTDSEGETDINLTGTHVKTELTRILLGAALPGEYRYALDNGEQTTVNGSGTTEDDRALLTASFQSSPSHIALNAGNYILVSSSSNGSPLLVLDNLVSSNAANSFVDNTPTLTARTVSAPSNPLAVGDAWKLSIDLFESTGDYTSTLPIQPAGINWSTITSGFAADITTNAPEIKAAQIDSKLLLYRDSSDGFNSSLLIDVANETSNATTVSIATINGGSVHAGDTWKLGLEASDDVAAVARTTSSSSVTVLRDELVAQIAASDHFTAFASGPDRVVILNTSGKSMTALTPSIIPNGTTSESPASTERLTIEGPIHPGDTWRYSLNSSPMDAISITSSDINALASSLDATIDSQTGFDSFMDGDEVVIVRRDNTEFSASLIEIQRNPQMATASVVGHTDINWTSTLALQSNSINPASRDGDIWNLIVDGEVISDEIGAAAEDGLNLTASTLAALINATDDRFSDSTGREITVVNTQNGDPVDLGGLTEFRANPYSLREETVYDGDHYLQAQIGFTQPYRAGDQYVLSLDGLDYSFTAPAGRPRAERNSVTIVEGLA
ncbi:MAG: hypothetical protein HOB20_08455, partial [Planctomycetaceae bacterium]|nr:hypothetical protein [Planctomycetaceae bacterium]